MTSFQVAEQEAELNELRKLRRLHERIRDRFSDPIVAPLPRGVLSGSECELTHVASSG